MTADQPPQPTDPPASEPPGDVIPVSDFCWIPRQQVQWTFSRSSGPGGQSVNKTASRAQLRVSIDDIVGLDEPATRRLRRLAGQRINAEDELIISADTHRSQLDNRRACEERLRELVHKAITPPKKRKPTRPSKGAIERRIKQKKEQAEKKRRRQRDRSPRDHF